MPVFNIAFGVMFLGPRILLHVVHATWIPVFQILHGTAVTPLGAGVTPDRIRHGRFNTREERVVFEVDRPRLVQVVPAERVTPAIVAISVVQLMASAVGHVRVACQHLESSGMMPTGERLHQTGRGGVHKQNIRLMRAVWSNDEPLLRPPAELTVNGVAWPLMFCCNQSEVLRVASIDKAVLVR